MSYSSLGGICQAKNGTPFSQSTTPVVKTVLLSNYGGVGYQPGKSGNDALIPSSDQCGSHSNFKNAYAVQSNPYGSSMMMQKQ